MAPKVVGSSPSIYPINLKPPFKSYNIFVFIFSNVVLISAVKFLCKLSFFTRYYLLNNLIWQEALLIDFLQKKSVDGWMRKFLISASYLFNERVLFDFIVRFPLDLIIWPLHRLFIFESNNVHNLLSSILFLFFFVVICLSLAWCINLLF